MVLVLILLSTFTLMQTDRPYSYLVPEAMQEQIAIGIPGSHVPFGEKSSLQGFIVAWKSGKFKRSS